LRHVIIPLISPVILFNLVIGVIYSFQVFTQALVIGGPTGEPLESTLMFLVLIYRNAFRYFSMGYAAALSVVLFAVVLLLTLLIFRSARSWVHYEGGPR
jgi:multiple sugar transport system permease protein